MAVEDVLNPANRTVTDPRAQREKVDEAGKEAEYWERKAKIAQSRREYEEQERRARQAEMMEHDPPEAPFTVKGSVNLGDFDMQAQQKELQANIEKIQDKAKADIDLLSQQKENYREELHKVQLQMVENSMKAQMDYLTKIIQENNGRKDPNIMEQIEQISSIAARLGYAPPGDGSDMPAGLRLQIMKMDIDREQAQRQFEWDKMQSEREWTLQLKKMEQESHIRANEIAAEREKRNMFISPFEAIGSAIARGLLDNGGQIPQPENTGPKPQKRKKSLHRLQANEGDAGEIPCPDCGEMVAIAPTARTAICASCESQFSIDRLPGNQTKHGPDEEVSERVRKEEIL